MSNKFSWVRLVWKVNQGDEKLLYDNKVDGWRDWWSIVENVVKKYAAVCLLYVFKLAIKQFSLSRICSFPTFLIMCFLKFKPCKQRIWFDKCEKLCCCKFPCSYFMTFTFLLRARLIPYKVKQKTFLTHHVPYF